MKASRDAGGCSSGPARPLSVLLTHGSENPAMPYPGGCVANLGRAYNRGRVIRAEATRDIFLTLQSLLDAIEHKAD